MINLFKSSKKGFEKMSVKSTKQSESENATAIHSTLFPFVLPLFVAYFLLTYFNSWLKKNLIYTRIPLLEKKSFFSSDFLTRLRYVEGFILSLSWE